MNCNANPDAFQSLLKESVDRFLNEFRKGTTDFSNFTSIFSRFLQNLPDPPLEIVWFYSALTFHSTKFSAQNSSCPVLLAKHLFQLLVSCSSSCNAVKKIAVLAPVIYQLNGLVSKTEKWTSQAEGLLEVIVCYISICCGHNVENTVEFGGLSCCFMDSVRVWMVERIDDSCKLGGELSMFFPLVSDGILKEMISEGCEVGYLAGIVMAEIFVLRLCLKFVSGISRTELERELHDWAVQTVTAFRSFHFLDVLLRILLEPVLSVLSLLNPEDELFLRKVLCDVAVVEHSFLGFQKWIHLPEGSLKNLAIRWLFVAHNGVQFLTECGEKTNYVQAFSESCMLSQLIEWVVNQPDLHNKTSKPMVSTPLSVVEWLLILEDEGLRVFDSDKSKSYGKSIISKSSKEYPLFVAESDGKGEEKVDSDLEMVDCEETTMFSGIVKPTLTNGTKKRKEGTMDEGNKQVKFVKFHMATQKGSALDDDESFSSGSEVDNPPSGENMELMEQ